ncbi:MAG: TetR/AcrR family transcriptional regulator [Gammaproteobacteria bacterium]|nr:TetR/AcrR family transcriptional regulator [Gammaproteobacteria bacterium]
MNPMDDVNDGGSTAGITDGRIHRSIRTKAAIAAAFVTLVDGGNLAPTSHEVAAQAGVGHRTVFRHFQDMDSLFASIREEIAKRAQPILAGQVFTGSLSQRVHQLVLQRIRFHTRITNFRRALVARYWTSPTMQALVHKDQAMLRELTRDALPEARDLPASDFELLELLLSFEAWSRLRELQGLSERKARDVIESGVMRLLKEGSRS